MNQAGKAKVKDIAGRVHQTKSGMDAAAREIVDRGVKYQQKRELMTATVINAMANVVLSTAVLVAVWFLAHVAPVYFAADHGRLLRMYALDEPYRAPADVIGYAKTTLDRTFALDFSNYQMQLEDLRPRYTQDGFKNLLEGLKGNGMLDMIRTKRMNLTSSTGTGVLVEQGNEQGVYSWVVRFPLTLKLVGQTTEMPDQKLIATVRVRRIPTLDSVEGIGVAEVVTKPM